MCAVNTSNTTPNIHTLALMRVISHFHTCEVNSVNQSQDMLYGDFWPVTYLYEISKDSTF